MPGQEEMDVLEQETLTEPPFILSSSCSISVIIPALNESANIRRCVDSAWQAGADQVIVVDGGSTDGTAAMIEDQRTLLLHSNPGRALQQNKGAVQACGDMLLFLHADCELSPTTLCQIREAASQRSIIFGAFHQSIRSEGWMYRWLEKGNDLRARWFSLPYGDQAIFVPRSQFNSRGGFPEIPLMEDLELSLQLRRVGRCLLLPGPIHVGARRWQERGIVRQTLRNWILCTAYRCGIPAAKLAKFYPAAAPP